jgi:hypothetical protein
MALRNVASQTTAGTSVVVTKPTGTADGDILVAVISSNDAGSSTLTFPAGFVQLTGSPVDMATSDGQTFGVALKVASSEGANYTLSTNNGTCIAAIAAFSGRDPSTTPHRQSVTPDTNGGGSSDVTITSTAFATATDTDGCDIIWISTVDPVSGTPAISFTPPSGYNNAININDGGGSGIGLANLDNQTAGVTGSTTADCVNAGNRFANFMVALAPSAGGGGGGTPGDPAVRAPLFTMLIRA